MEIKLVQNKGIEVLEKCGFCKGWEYPRGGLSGGLLLGWQPNLNLSIQYSSKHLIHADRLDHKGIKKLSIKAKCKKSNHIQSKPKASPTKAGKFSLRWQQAETERLGDMVSLLKPILWMGVLFSKVEPIVVGSLSTWQLRKHWWNLFSKPKI